MKRYFIIVIIFISVILPSAGLAQKSKVNRKLVKKTGAVSRAVPKAKKMTMSPTVSLRQEVVANILNDQVTGENLEIRKVAREALGSRAGTVVVMEVHTGKIVTIINQEWAIHKGFKPCSTIKLVTGLAGVTEEVINDNGVIPSLAMTLDDALAYSSNIYFQRVGAGIGSTKLITYAQALGLGKPTGINASGEYPGKLPYGNNNARIYSHGDDFEVTPLQLAVLVSIITNGGKKVIPHIPTSLENTQAISSPRKQVSLSQANLQELIPGMKGAAQYGTAHKSVDATLGIAGKTGSCIAKGSWVGLFASVAPINNPQFAVVVITRGANERGKYAALVAGKIYQALVGPAPSSVEPVSIAANK